MKKKLVLWGKDAADQKILLALSLREKENKVDIFIFQEKDATEVFYNLLMNEWRKDKEVPFPAEHKHLERELSVAESILPIDIKVDQGDLIQRAQTEWHFIVLSTKLSQLYHNELDEFKEKIEGLSEFHGETWESLKTFWSKVQEQVHEKNLFRDHADDLRNRTNELFGSMKQFRRKMDQDFKKTSSEFVGQFGEKLDDIEKRVSEGLGLGPIFEELKNLQNQFRDTAFTKDDRSKIWKRIDKAFKIVKEKKYGPGSNQSSNASSRLQKRYDGLINAIGKMEKSIQRDRKEKAFQDTRIERSDGQLETQIRQAKLKMVEERIRSKEAKLADMKKTQGELESKMAQEKKKEAKKAEKAKIVEKEGEIKEKIASKIKEDAEARDVDKEKLEQAATDLKSKKKTAKKEEKPAEQKEATPEAKKEAEPEASTINEEEKAESPQVESLLGAAGAVLSESLKDVVDTVKAIGEVVGEKIEDAVDAITEEE